MALIYRAHFAFSKNPRISSTGINTSAVFGFANSLMEVIIKEAPTHIGVAFDTASPTFRHESFEAYKANRQEQPEDIRVAIPYVIRLLECFRIPVLMLDGYEADDIIGTLATQAGKEGFEVYMMTMDKDYSQLVNEQVFLYRPAYMGNGHEIYDTARVLEKFQIQHVDQVRDILGLMGDAVDNIPGIPGIGEKTARKLIAEFGTVENLIANADKLKGKQKENVINFGAQGILSKELATIHLNVPIAFDEEALRYKGPDKEPLLSLCDELEFRTLKKRLFGEENPAPAKTISTGGQMELFSSATPEDKATLLIVSADPENAVEAPREALDSIATVIHDYYIMDTAEKRRLLLESLLSRKEFCFDTETTAINAFEAQLVGIAFSWRAGEAYYVPLPSDDQKTCQRIIDEFRPALEHETILKIGQNLKYDALVLKNYGITIQGPFFDTMLAHYLIEPDMRHNMDALAEIYLNYACISIEELIGKKGSKQKSMKDVPVELVAEYAAEDADITFRLKKVFEEKLRESDTLALFEKVEVPLISVLADMEYNGVAINTESLREYSGLLKDEIATIEKSIFEKAGQEFNIASPRQLGEVLFEKLRLDDKAKKTKTGQYATGEEVLIRLAGSHTIIRDILDFRELQKLKNTYVDTLPTLISSKDGRVHTCYNQAVAATGRLSSTNPNLQNIPVKTARGREIRKAFVARDPNHRILSADYSQIELRVMASFSKEQNMIEAFREGRDIHSTTASRVYNTPLTEVTSEMRSKAKMVNFGIIYGISAFGLSQRLDIPRREAADIIEAYFREFPAIKIYMDEVINQAREREYVETILGRRRYLRDINSRNITMRGFAERNAINAPIQGSAADMIKVAMINIDQWLRKEKLRTKMILQVHDELVFDVPVDEIPVLQSKVEELMKTAIPMEVPMEVGIGIGTNWLEAH